MPGLVVDAIAKRDVQLPYVRIFLSVSDGARGVSDLTSEDVKIESGGEGSPYALTAIYPEAFLAGKYIAVVQPMASFRPKNAPSGHDGEVIFTINVHHPAPPNAGTDHGQTVVYLPARSEE
jgi:hypothetical protein